MKLKQLLSVVIALLAFLGTSQAITAKSKPLFSLVTAYSKKVTEKMQTNPPMAGTFLVIKWGSTSYPESFFWRGENGWLNCNIEKATKVIRNGKTEYTGKEIAIDKIKKGDLLLLTPVTGGRFPIPEEIPATATNTIFYKAGGSAWLAYPVKKIAEH